MSDDQRAAGWRPRTPQASPPNHCKRCGASPVLGRGLCAYHYAKVRTHLHAVGEFESLMVPVDAARERVAALRAAGIGLPRLVELTGVPGMTLWRLTNEPNRTLTSRDVERAVLEVEVPTQRVDPLLAPGARVPVVPSQRRIRALAVVGYGQDHLLTYLGLKVGSCALNKVYSAALPSVTAKRHRAIAAMFDELVWKRGPSARATRDAVRKGWWGPWAWDDIDDPDCVPDAVTYRVDRRRMDARRARNTLLEDQLADMIACGRVRPDDDNAVAAILGITPQSAEQRRMRANRAARAEGVAS